MIVYLPLLVALVGALVYALSTNGKVAELGLVMFLCGTLAFLLLFRGQPVTLLK